MINDAARPKFRDSQKTGAGNIFIPALSCPAAPTSPRNEGGKGQTREIVPRQKAFTGEIAIGIEVRLNEIVNDAMRSQREHEEAKRMRSEAEAQLELLREKGSSIQAEDRKSVV